MHTLDQCKQDVGPPKGLRRGREASIPPPDTGKGKNKKKEERTARASGLLGTPERTRIKTGKRKRTRHQRKIARLEAQFAFINKRRRKDPGEGEKGIKKFKEH